MTVKVLIKVKGRHISWTAVHLYDAENDCALCRSWPKPGGDWEVREVESFSGHGWKCCHCIAKLQKAAEPPEPPRKPRQPSKRKMLLFNAHEKELEAWERFTGKPHETEAILIA